MMPHSGQDPSDTMDRVNRKGTQQESQRFIVREEFGEPKLYGSSAMDKHELQDSLVSRSGASMYGRRAQDGGKDDN